jgi:hypothetical protein
MPPEAEVSWRQAFEDWCQRRQITAAEAQACALTSQANRLIIAGSAKVQERLRGSKGDTWLLAGSGLTRPALRLHVGG